MYRTFTYNEWSLSMYKKIGLLFFLTLFLTACSRAKISVNEVDVIHDDTKGTVEISTIEMAEPQTQTQPTEYETLPHTVQPEEVVQDAKESMSDALVSKKKVNIISEGIDWISNEGDAVDCGQNSRFKQMYLKDYNLIYDMGNTVSEEPLQWNEFAVVDLNGDNVKEVILLSDEGTLLLYNYEGEIYAVPVSNRLFNKEMYDITNDGIVYHSVSQSRYDYWILRKGRTYMITLAQKEYTVNDTVEYYRLGIKVTEDEYNDYIMKLVPDVTDTVVWQKFTPDNIAGIAKN